MTPDLPKARGFLYLPLGEGGSAQPRRKRGGTRSFLYAAPHPSWATPVLGYAQSTLSQERA